MDVNRLLHATTIAEHGTFGAAARVLHMSQSALTRSIQALEADFGIRLFERGRSGATLTAEGARFLAHAEQLVRHAVYVERDLREISAGREAAVNVGVGPISASLFLPRVLTELLTLSQSFPIRVKVGSNSELHYMLSAGQLDFYVGGVPRESSATVTDGAFRVEPVQGKSRLALLVRHGHPLLAHPDDLAARKRYQVVAGTFARDTAVGADVERHGFAPVALMLDDYDLLAGLVRQTDAVLLATELIGVLRPELELEALAIELAPSIEANYALVSSRIRRPSTAARQVAALLREAVTGAYE